MANPTMYPTGADLAVFLTDSGMAIPANMDLDVLAAAASGEWEHRTGWQPFLQVSDEESYVTTRRFDPPGPKPPASRPTRMGGAYRLPIGAFLTVEAVRISVSTTDAGSLLVLGEDYDLEPYDADGASKPYTSIRFRFPVYGQPRSVSVKGLPGYCSSLSAEVRRALLMMAGASFCLQIRQGLATTAVEWAEGIERERYSIEMLREMGDGWAAQADATLREHMRWD